MQSNINSHSNVHEQKLSNLLDSASDLFCTIEENTNFDEVSNSVVSLLGYKPEQIIGKHFTDFIHPDDLQKIRISIDSIKSGDAVNNIEIRYI